LQEALPLAEETSFTDRSRNVYAALRPEGMLMDTLLSMPTLDQSFKGIKLEASYLSDLSLRQAKACGAWLGRRGLDVIVDFAPMLDHYPHISFIRNREIKIERNLAWAKEILEKAKVLGATKILLMHHRNAENHRSIEQAEEDMQTSFKEFTVLAGEYGMEVVGMNGLPNAVLGSIADLRRCYPEKPYAVNLSHSLLTGERLTREDYEKAVGLLISVPVKDELGQVSDGHMPLTGSVYRERVEALLKTLPLDAYGFVILDGDYRNYDELYLDRKLLEEAEG